MTSIEQQQGTDLAPRRSGFGLGVIVGVAGAILLPIFFGAIIHLVLIVALIAVALVGVLAIGRRVFQ